MSSVREKTFTKYVSSPIGVTSHTTPHPAGEGLGEGPLSVWVCETCSSVFIYEKKKARGSLGVLSLTEFTE